jgi:hypothetical protein
LAFKRAIRATSWRSPKNLKAFLAVLALDQGEGGVLNLQRWLPDNGLSYAKIEVEARLLCPCERR